MNYIKDNIIDINKNIKESIQKANREDNVTLIAVTKTVDIDKIQIAINNGITDVGENKAQELDRKFKIIGNDVRWHLIGSLQTNKVRYIIDKVYMIHSLDRISLCEEIQKRSEKINRNINCLVQVNISREETKQGLYIEEVEAFIKEVSKNYKNIKIQGLMTMAPFTDNHEEIRSVFERLKKLSLDIDNLGIKDVEMKNLSMGMSNDYELAIEEGATMIRVGTSIFGKRNY